MSIEENNMLEEGGKCILEFDTIKVWVSELGTDRTGMGRWCWIKLNGNNGHMCRIVFHTNLV